MLTTREQRFVNAYLGEAAGNGQKAAELAGYAKKSARITASKLLKKANIRAAVANKQARLDEKAEITVDRVLAELASVAFSDVRVLFDDAGNLRPVQQLSDEAARALASVEVAREKTTRLGSAESGIKVEESVIKLKQWDKLRALEMIAKLRGMFPSEKHEHTLRTSLVDLLAPQLSEGARP